MLRQELAGVPFNKAAHNAQLRELLGGRSAGSVEFKHANVSAVLTLHGYPYIDGYKPRSNFQALLEQVVLEYLEVHGDFFKALLNGPVLDPQGSPIASSFSFDRARSALFVRGAPAPEFLHLSAQLLALQPFLARRGSRLRRPCASSASSPPA